MATITFLRHGNAAPHEEDRLRPLSERGRAQASERRAKLGNPTFDLIIASDSVRARKTAEIVSGEQEIYILDVSLLLPPPDPDIDGLFERLGYAPLQTYLNANTPGTQKLTEYARQAAGEIVTIVAESVWASGLDDDSSDEYKVLAVGHAIILSLVGLSICRAPLGSTSAGLGDITSSMLSLNLSECEGFQFDASPFKPEARFSQPFLTIRDFRMICD